MRANKFTKFKLIVRDARVFPGIWFDFIYPHNSSLFFAPPQIYVAADKKKIYSPSTFPGTLPKENNISKIKLNPTTLLH